MFARMSIMARLMRQFKSIVNGDICEAWPMA
jgi:hypothetical protein